jgi:hypothetical protein
MKKKELEKLSKNIRDKPEIGEKSKKIASEKLQNSNVNIAERLAKEKLGKSKKIISQKKKDDKKKSKAQFNEEELEQKQKNLKLNKSEVLELVSKLHKEAEEKKKEKTEVTNNNTKAILSQSTASLRSNLYILKKFTSSWLEEVPKILKNENSEEKEGSSENFPTEGKLSLFKFIYLLKNLDIINMTEDFTQEKIDSILLEKKGKRDGTYSDPAKTQVKLANILRKMCLVNNNEGSEENDSVDLLKLYLYLTTILGVYKGEEAQSKDVKQVSQNEENNKKSAFKNKVTRKLHKAAGKEINKRNIRLFNIISKQTKNQAFSTLTLDSSTAKSIEVKFRIFRETWIEHHVDVKRKTDINNEDVIEIYRNNLSNKKANNFRKKCLEMVKEDVMNNTKMDETSFLNESQNLNYMVKNESKIRLMDIYQILKNKKKK